MDGIIGKLLRAGLLVTLGEDQERAVRLRAASQHLCDRFIGESRADIPSALLAAVDEECPDHVPILKTTRDAIVDQWETFENTYVQQDPSSILRAVTLEAVVGATKADAQIAAAVWYTLRDVAEIVSLGRWVQPITDFRDDLDATMSQRINDTWEPTASYSSLRMPPVSAVDETRPVKVAALKQFRTTVEQQGPDHAVNQELSDLLEELLTAVTQHSQSAHAAETERLKSVLGALGKQLHDALAAHESRIMAVEHRDSLLWWRLGGRSDLLGTRYREAPDPAAVAVAAAFDLRARVPNIAPEAVEQLLIDILDEAELSKMQVTAGDMAAACDHLKLTTPIDASPPLLIGDVVVGGLDPNGLVRALQEPLPAPVAAATLFRDLQVRRLLADESPEEGSDD